MKRITFVEGQCRSSISFRLSYMLGGRNSDYLVTAFMKSFSLISFVVSSNISRL